MFTVSQHTLYYPCALHWLTGQHDELLLRCQCDESSPVFHYWVAVYQVLPRDPASLSS